MGDIKLYDMSEQDINTDPLSQDLQQGYCDDIQTK